MRYSKEDIDLIEWSKYETAYGIANKVPDQLKKLYSSNRKEQLNATHDLWCGLCHQHAYISSASLPAYPFLKKVLTNANEELMIELLDIFAGFAICSAVQHPEGHGLLQTDMRKLLNMDFDFFKEIEKIEGEEGFAELITEQIEKNA